MERINILGINFNNVTLKDATSIAMNCIENGEKGYVVTPNSEIGYMCLTDNELLNILNNAKLILPDGIGIIYSGKMLKTPFKQKVAGIEFAENLVCKMAEKEKSLFILGGKPEVAKTACEKLADKYKGLQIAGYMDGYFSDESKAIDAINAQKVDVLFVCLGAPKQERFIDRNFDKINATIICGVGGSADVFAGEAKRAPDIFVKLGLEWFYRLLKQPYRIGRMAKIPLYLFEVAKSRKK